MAKKCFSHLFNLNDQDMVGVMAPSSYIDKSDITTAADILSKHGLRTFVHPQTFNQDGQSAGSGKEKAAAFHDLVKDPNIKAIWAAGGGNRAITMIEHLDFDLIKSNPKPLIGFSDITILLHTLYVRSNLPSIHGSVFAHIPRRGHADIAHVTSLLKGEISEITIHGATDEKNLNAQGILIGGNLSLLPPLVAIHGSDYLKNSILFIEDCNEELSHIDRNLQTLRQSGALSRINGLIVGRFSDCRDSGRPFGHDLSAIISAALSGHHIPVWHCDDFGHGDGITAYPHGVWVKIQNGVISPLKDGSKTETKPLENH